MIPLRDTIRTRHFPWVNWLVIIANFAIFLYEISLSSSGFENLINRWGLTPSLVHWQQPATLPPFITSMFLHGGWFHIISNMWVLFIFGDNVEDRMGSLRYLVFYILAGLAAGAMVVAVTPSSAVPTIGASGAIAGVLGAYFFTIPAQKS